MNLAFDSDRGGRDQWVAWLASIMAECRRLLKPGGYALVWALPRTSHWTGMALEDAGFELRDQISHLFGSGFPKSHSCLKPAHEIWWLARAPGPLQPLQIEACRVPTGEDLNGGAYAADKHKRGGIYGKLDYQCGNYQQPPGRWPGNLVLSHVPPASDGTGGCRPAGVQRVRGNGHYPAARGAGGLGTAGHSGQAGLDERFMDAEQVVAWDCVPRCPIRLLDEQAGPRTSKWGKQGERGAHSMFFGPRSGAQLSSSERFIGDTGSASRFFPTFAGAPEAEDAEWVPFRYCAKAPTRERRLADGMRTGHPTQKPVDLARWLCRLICAPGGTILDPFCGVASIGVAALREGFSYIGIEQDEGYASMARRRLAEEQEQQTGPLFAGVAP